MVILILGYLDSILYDAMLHIHIHILFNLIFIFILMFIPHC